MEEDDAVRCPVCSLHGLLQHASLHVETCQSPIIPQATSHVNCHRHIPPPPCLSVTCRRDALEPTGWSLSSDNMVTIFNEVKLNIFLTAHQQ